MIPLNGIPHYLRQTVRMPTGQVGEHVCHAVYTKGDHDFPDVIMASPFCLVTLPFLRGKRQSTRIYG